MNSNIAATRQTLLSRKVPPLKVAVFMVASFAVMFLVGSVYSIVNSGVEESRESSEMQTARSINLALYQYAQDHGGKYPTGKSSTDIFQQLLDQKFVTDPKLFYFPMSGKSEAEGTTLKSENVCWDMTNNIRSDDPDQLPIVFTTGYKIDYMPNGKAHPLGKKLLGISVAYFSNSAYFLHAIMPSGVVPNVVSAEFNSKGRTYQQLTPDGPLNETAQESK